MSDVTSTDPTADPAPDSIPNPTPTAPESTPEAAPDIVAAIADFEAELKTATGDRAEAIKASIRSLKNPGLTTDAEALAAEGDTGKA